MQSHTFKSLLFVFLTAALVFSGLSCVENTTPAPQPLPPSEPVINSFTANPTSITKGDSCTLAWDVTGAASVVIDSGIGAIPASGDIEIKPSSTTTYTLEATTPGRVTKSVTVIVTAPPPPVEEPASPPPIAEPISSTPERKYDSSLPTQKGAFRGKVLWGDKPVAKGKVVAGIENPEKYTIDPDDLITDITDGEGNYELWVNPSTYYIGCIMPGSDRVSYWGEYGQEVAAREAVTMNLQAIDWSIRSISPGTIQRDTGLITDENPPTLLWEKYDWAEYGETGYYQVKLSTDDSIYFSEIIIEDNTESASYALSTPLKKGKYRWQVMAYTKNDKPIAGYINERHFEIR